MASKEYQVTWKMPIDAEDPVDAAVSALRIMRDKDSIATVFDVTDPDDGLTYEIDIELEEIG